MLIYKNISDDSIVRGDQVTESSIRIIARFVNGSYHIEKHGQEVLPWIEIHRQGGIVDVAHIGDYFYTHDGIEFFFAPQAEFERLYLEQYDPVADGDENRYFNPETDEHRPWKDSEE